MHSFNLSDICYLIRLTLLVTYFTKFWILEQFLIMVLHLGHSGYLIWLFLFSESIQFCKARCSMTCLQSSRNINRASSSCSKPNLSSNTSALYALQSLTLQTGGHVSPQNPMQGWPHFSFFGHGWLQGSLSQISPHFFVQGVCSHPSLQGSIHGWQTSPQSLVHLEWEQEMIQGRVQGGH